MMFKIKYLKYQNRYFKKSDIIKFKQIQKMNIYFYLRIININYSQILRVKCVINLSNNYPPFYN